MTDVQTASYIYTRMAPYFSLCCSDLIRYLFNNLVVHLYCKTVKYLVSFREAVLGVFFLIGKYMYLL